MILLGTLIADSDALRTKRRALLLRLEHLERSCDKERLMDLLSMLDKDNDGGVEKFEFVVGMLLQVSSHRRRLLHVSGISSSLATSSRPPGRRHGRRPEPAHAEHTHASMHSSTHPHKRAATHAAMHVYRRTRVVRRTLPRAHQAGVVEESDVSNPNPNPNPNPNRVHIRREWWRSLTWPLTSRSLSAPTRAETAS